MKKNACVLLGMFLVSLGFVIGFVLQPFGRIDGVGPIHMGCSIPQYTSAEVSTINDRIKAAGMKDTYAVLYDGSKLRIVAYDFGVFGKRKAFKKARAVFDFIPVCSDCGLGFTNQVTKGKEKKGEL
jgi:hypothetical protein